MMNTFYLISPLGKPLKQFLGIVLLMLANLAPLYYHLHPNLGRVHEAMRQHITITQYIDKATGFAWPQVSAIGQQFLYESHNCSVSNNNRKPGV